MIAGRASALIASRPHTAAPSLPTGAISWWMMEDLVGTADGVGVSLLPVRIGANLIAQSGLPRPTWIAASQMLAPSGGFYNSATTGALTNCTFMLSLDQLGTGSSNLFATATLFRLRVTPTTFTIQKNAAPYNASSTSWTWTPGVMWLRKTANVFTIGVDTGTTLATVTMTLTATDTTTFSLGPQTGSQFGSGALWDRVLSDSEIAAAAGVLA